MRTKWERLTTLAFTAAALLALGACSAPPKPAADTNTTASPKQLKGKSRTVVKVQPGEPGGAVVQTFQKMATVMGIDRQKRQVKLVTPDGVQTIVKAGPEVANFDQIQLGDRVKATITEELVVFVRKSGEAPGDGETSAVAVAPAGAKPALITISTVEIAGTITDLDPAQHKATLEFPDGQKRTFKVRPDLDLTKRSVGEEVVIRSTESMALLVEKP